ncbi:LCP family protein [Ruminococcus sp. CLA-AA-H200]|uniref:LCP family protein n=1 Tax=Ruminococcus turbiniformis TaxID=2881258 RepID=A0ABS8FVQ9_9FIRM|nr:LCP family protein [Ruminococcus turbiniformis]MCC2254125.1 LCP family protein [Ruminococcus turbiniformis]
MSKKQRTAEDAGRKKRNTGKISGRSRRNRFGSFCLILQALLSIVFMGVVVLLNMLPLNYLALVAMVLVFLWCIAFTSQAVRRKRGTVGKVYSLFMICVLTVGTYYVARTNNMIAAITGSFFQVDSMVVAVLADDPAETLEDAADYTFGVQFEQGGENMQTAITDIQDQLGTDINMTEYSSVQAEAQALLDGEVQAIIYNQSYTSILNESIENFSSSVKIISRLEVRSELSLGASGSDDSLVKEPFTVYISGMDTYGEDSDDGRDSSRSDVNIIAVVNPTTHQILLVTTPRDYYVPIPGVSDGMNDKLTHAGTYGLDASMATLGNLYETEINYYVQLNFTSLIDIVDILGGVDVYSEYAFTTGWESGLEMDVQEGMNHFNGQQALAFCRERHALVDGDNQRGKNQQAVITAMLKKVLSPTILLRANSIINQVSNDVETNVTQAQLNSLIRNQLSTGAEWSIQSVAATGTDGEDYCYSAMDSLLYVIYPDYEVVNGIIDLANVVEEGGSLEDGEALN